MTVTLKKPLYTAEATVKGGRDGHGRSSDGVLDLDIRPPVEMGGQGGGPTPSSCSRWGTPPAFRAPWGSWGGG